MKKTIRFLSLLLALLLLVPAAMAETTLAFFSNVPDRISGLGLLEETNLKAFQELHPDVDFAVEYLQDEPYKVKFQTYMQANNMPDVWMQWGLTSSIAPVLEGNFAMELNPADYEDYKFVAGALDAFMQDGKLYGLPKNADFWVIYYNEALFEEFDVKLPETTDDLIAAADVFNKNGIIPMAFDGKDGWPTAVTIHNLVMRASGDVVSPVESLLAAKTSSDENYKKGAEEFVRLVENNVFQPSFNSDDYGTAKNLFVQGVAAMFAMGSWEMGMGADEQIDPAVRDHIRAIRFPNVAGFEKSNHDDLVMWYGGGYSVSATTEHPEEAVALLNYLASPAAYAKNAWQMQITIPPMDYTAYLTGDENPLQLDLTDIMTNARATSGECYQDRISASFKENSQNLSIELASKMITVDEFLTRLDQLVTDELAAQ